MSRKEGIVKRYTYAPYLIKAAPRRLASAFTYTYYDSFAHLYAAHLILQGGKTWHELYRYAAMRGGDKKHYVYDKVVIYHHKGKVYPSRAKYREDYSKLEEDTPHE